MTYRDYRIGFSGTDLISPTQFEYYPELKYRMPQALAHAFKRLFCVLLERLGLIALLERVSMSATFGSGESIHRQSHF